MTRILEARQHTFALHPGDVRLDASGLEGVVVVDGDHRGDEAGHANGLQVGAGQVLVQLVEVVHGEENTENVDEDPEDVEDVVPERTLDQGTRRPVQVTF